MDTNKQINKNTKNKTNKLSLHSSYILENIDSFNLTHIFECGQCFRWNYDSKQDRYIGVVGGNVIAVNEETSICNDGSELKKWKFVSTINNSTQLMNFVRKYFNLDLEYNKIKEELLEKNTINILGQQEKEETKILEHSIALKEAIEYGYGIRILKQDFWETVVSYIISANNNIPRIKKIIETLSEKYGNEIIFENKQYYSFPSPEQLSKASVADLRECGLGFRDKRVYDITRVFLDKKDGIIDNKKDTTLLKNDLMQYNGIGPKVADCILLFGLNKYEIFPIDVWVRRVMNDIYFKKQDETKLTNDEILRFTSRKYGSYGGIAQQYLFYWKRETYVR